jgi:uncharacterized Zn finger protein
VHDSRSEPYAASIITALNKAQRTDLTETLAAQTLRRAALPADEIPREVTDLFMERRPPRFPSSLPSPASTPVRSRW